MKETISKLLLVIFDLLSMAMSIVVAYFVVTILGWVDDTSYMNLYQHITSIGIYLITIFLFAYSGVYWYRFDFWSESKIIIKSIIASFVLLLAYLAITKSIDQYSRGILIFSYVMMMFAVPLVKYLAKTTMYRFGIWSRAVKVISDEQDLKVEIFLNPYLGYTKSTKADTKTIFINPKHRSIDTLAEILDIEMHKRDRVIFVPALNSYDLTQSQIYNLSASKNNLIVLTNKLKSKPRQLLQNIFNYILAILLLPILLPIIGILAYKIKRESPGPIFFAHNRIGKNGKIIPTLKFRSMYQDSKARLEKLLSENDEIRQEWQANFKLKNDPRVTKIGAFLRKTSLDELPQIFNVLKGEMNFVGPRPVVQEEIDKYYKKDANYYFMVKPGITGLWQVSGRSDTDYDFRIRTDKWYIQNWSLWLDVVIMFKTVKVVLFREGAY